MVDVRTLAISNLTFQLLLIILVSGAAYLAKKKELGTHCKVMRGAVLAQIIAIAGIMLPSMLGYILNVRDNTYLNIEILTHHTLGLAVIVLWIYINLVFSGKAKTNIKLVTFMRAALLLWVSSLLLGLHLYTRIYL